jgi:hypothetical protein
MNFSNIYSYINIPTRDSINNVLTSISNNVMFYGRSIKQYTPKRVFTAAATFIFYHTTIISAVAYFKEGDLHFLFNNMNMFILVELAVFLMSFFVFFSLENNVHLIIIKQFKDYQREKKLTLAIKNLQPLPKNYNYNKAKECPITYDKLPEDATICYGKTLYDANALYKWLLKGNDIDPMTAQKIIWSKLYKVSPVTVKSILNSDC